jgi:hypothetical protein
LDYVAPAFVLVQSSGKRRVVVDFDKLNKETLKSAFRYEILKSLRHLAKRGDWAISFDLDGTGFMPFPSTRTTGSTLPFPSVGKLYSSSRPFPSVGH